MQTKLDQLEKSSIDAVDEGEPPVYVTVGGHTGRILVVDDDVDFADSLREVLEQWGYIVETINDASRGNSVIDEFDPMLALIDVRLGERDGIELLSKFMDHKPGLMCVMVTAYAEIETTLLALRKGAYDFLLKPVHPNELHATIDRCFQLLQLQHDKAAAEAASDASREQLRGLAAHLQSVREQERMSVSRELHDELSQVLTAIKMNLGAIEREIKDVRNTDDARAILPEIELVNGLIDQTVDRLINLTTILRPDVLDNLGLVAALQWYSEDFSKRTKIRCEFACNVDSVDEDEDVAIAIFRIVQETLTNVARHAQANLVRIGLYKTNEDLLLEVEDDGIGIAREALTKSNHFGLVGMRERTVVLGGALDITTEPGSGTLIRVVIPLDAKNISKTPVN